MMTVQMDTERETVRYNIVRLLDELPPEALPMVETFVRFMQANSNTAVSPPPASTSSLNNLMGILPDDIEGDALLDTELAYDDV